MNLLFGRLSVFERVCGSAGAVVVSTAIGFVASGVEVGDGADAGDFGSGSEHLAFDVGAVASDLDVEVVDAVGEKFYFVDTDLADRVFDDRSLNPSAACFQPGDDVL